ncbi:amino acid ABC transporter permease [Actinacidiphila guanduensis]|uniref:Polar amino acid transport system permease protein n=1 Tax=Actinacidiphila guanduensis TaxID=310781 RepID=A0A1H0NER5_9ACTN|nr:amino acid ABC transporter permease [Actinacidiphila guanduensis]SDO91267.1 polar amino acid transport system permease protein [Actinacidiphila guanduensis]
MAPHTRSGPAAAELPAATGAGGGRELPAEPPRWHAILAVRPSGLPLTVVVLVLAAMGAHLLVTAPSIQWHVVAHYFTSSEVLDGLVRTIELTVLAMAIGVGLGAVLAVMRMARNPVLSGSAGLYIWFFRGAPLLVQILFWFNLASFIPRLSLGVPFGPSFTSWDTNHLVTPFVAAVLGLGLNEAAYMSEIVRAGILSVDAGQGEAAAALGMKRGHVMRRIVLPQAMRVIVPPTGNQMIGMLKSSSLVSVTSMPELLYSVQLVYSRTFQTIPLLVVATLWYLLMTTVLSWGQYYVERHFGRGSARELPPTPLRRTLDRIGAALARLERATARAGLDKHTGEAA